MKSGKAREGLQTLSTLIWHLYLACQHPSFLLLAELIRIQVVVDAPLAEQLLVASLLNDLAIVDDQDAVRRPDGG